MKIDLEELYWSNWDEIMEDIDKSREIFDYIKNFKSLDLKDLSDIIRLYNNPYGAYTIEFAEIIGQIYKYDRIKFIKSLNRVKDEIPNLVYAFRMENVFKDEDVELEEILNIDTLSNEEIETANSFFKMYKIICST